ncbi:hypothetical protein P152DRAFT_57069 [Eremomyces bilateralis CBS 781.70]|uniref:Uncharacterized protein n=1 Tax=Eremomyces bilateralis CBS 781.70 TaxID=1392243 RepID=A0A6G1G0C2_9PEZI|nr:uncharacterized protein P152DRAFT_57069 [Eremomyces bilateralis CBS 781.70]KAF1811468.1 hypothetical protein P152DRAFT_57069 [Eremomyces bilateralis CBS 781.70]
MTGSHHKVQHSTPLPIPSGQKHPERTAVTPDIRIMINDNEWVECRPEIMDYGLWSLLPKHPHYIEHQDQYCDSGSLGPFDSFRTGTACGHVLSSTIMPRAERARRKSPCCTEYYAPCRRLPVFPSMLISCDDAVFFQTFQDTEESERDSRLWWNAK